MTPFRLSITALILWLSTVGVMAQQVSFSAGPPRTGELNYKLKLDAGESSTQKVRITNSSEMALQFRIYRGQAVTGKNGSLDGPLFGQPVTGVGEWLSLEQSQVSLGANDRTDVSFKVTVPPGTAAGDHIGFVFVDIAPESLDALEDRTQDQPLAEDKASFRLRVSTRFALAVVVRVPGDVVADLTVDSVSKHIRDGKLGLTFRGQNSGRVYLKPTGRWTLYGPDQEVVARQDREPWGVLLPGSAFVKEVPIRTDTPLVRGVYRLEVEASYQDPGNPDEKDVKQLTRTLEITLP